MVSFRSRESLGSPRSTMGSPRSTVGSPRSALASARSHGSRGDGGFEAPRFADGSGASFESMDLRPGCPTRTLNNAAFKIVLVAATVLTIFAEGTRDLI